MKSTQPYYADDTITLLHGDALACAQSLPDRSVRTIVTSPPYFGLRDYDEDGQIGAEATVEEFVDRLVELFRELRRVLADDGTLWLNLGDSYVSSPPGNKPGEFSTSALTNPSRQNVVNRGNRDKTRLGLPAKNLLMVPARVALAMQADGWILRSDIIWAKTSTMPESVRDRPSSSHEHIFLFAKRPKYFYDHEAIMEDAADSTRARLAQDLEGQAGSTRANGGAKTNGTMKATGRPQLKRAIELATQHGLTDEHMAAIKAVGMSDAGKAQTTQSGTGKNTPEMQRLADEAKEVLGGYYREFLSDGKVNKRNVWSVSTVPFGEAHFAVYPPELIRPCILAGSQMGDTVLDPFSGSGTTGMVATQEGRRYIGFDLNAKFLDLSLNTRFAQPSLNFGAA